MAHAHEVFDDGGRDVGVGIGRAQRRGDEVEGALELRASGVAKRLGAEESAQGFLDVSPALLEGARDGVDGGDGRVVVDEAAAELRGEVARGRWMKRHEVEHAINVRRAEAGTDGLAEDNFRAVVVEVLPKFDAALVEQFLGTHGPAGEAAGDFHHVALRVAAVDAEGVQLHQLAGVILVGLFAGVVAAIHAPVEIPEHRGTERGGAEHVGEFAEGVLADDLAVVRRLEPLTIALGGIDVEVVSPELNHDFVKLPLAERGAQDRGAHHLVEEKLLLILEEVAGGIIQGLEATDLLRAPVVLDLLGSKLLVEEGGQGFRVGRAQRLHAGVIAGPRAKGEAVQRVADEINLCAGRRREGAAADGLARESGEEALRNLITARSGRECRCAADADKMPAGEVHGDYSFAAKVAAEEVSGGDRASATG